MAAAELWITFPVVGFTTSNVLPVKTSLPLIWRGIVRILVYQIFKFSKRLQILAPQTLEMRGPPYLNVELSMPTPVEPPRFPTRFRIIGGEFRGPVVVNLWTATR
jgi:hypothetical protein